MVTLIAEAGEFVSDSWWRVLLVVEDTRIWPLGRTARFSSVVVPGTRPTVVIGVFGLCGLPCTRPER